MFPRLVENCGSCLRTSVALLEVAALRTLQTPASLAHLLDGGLDEAGGGQTQRRALQALEELRAALALVRRHPLILRPHPLVDPGPQRVVAFV